MKRGLFVIFAGIWWAAALFAQTTNDTATEAVLPLKRVSLFSSGVGYFEHTGTITGNAFVKLSFGRAALNDALKSLVINDMEAGAPQVNYLSETTLRRTLQSLKIDLSGEPGLAGILRSLQGVELSVHFKPALPSGAIGAEEIIQGRIVAVDGTGLLSDGRAVLTLSTTAGVRTINLAQVTHFSFEDASIDSDLRRALDLISTSRTARSREINISLTGRRKREVTVSYVIPTPVWKISYRLDLNQTAPLLQSWAIIDNDGDTDWTGVEVSLISGKPVSFIQELYPPYYTSRPVLPLAGVGIAEAQTYDSGWLGANAASEDDYEYRSKQFAQEPAPAPYPNAPQGAPMIMRESQRSVLGGGGSIGAAQMQQAGEQFEFTLKKLVSLERQRSAMLPLFDGQIRARKILIFSGQRALSGAVINPSIGVELNNITGTKLPAGSITVFDHGTYAGDALLNFINTGEKQMISYGDDLAITGSLKTNTSRIISTVRISKGLATFNRKQIWSRTYTMRNSSGETKHLLIEHPITQGTTLTRPASFSEQTANLYRFEMDLRPNEILTFDVVEESPLAENLTLANLSTAGLLAYSNNGELEERVRKIFSEALRLKNSVDEIKKAVSDLENQRASRVADQERIRANLIATGSQTPEGKVYLQQLTALDKQIADATDEVEATRIKANNAQTAYENYIAGLEL